MTNATLDSDALHPLLLPSESHLTHLLIRHFHEQEVHATGGTVLSRLRERFWIVRGLATVRSALRQCIACRYSKATTLPRLYHGQLPRERVDSTQPAFHSILVDQLGPVHTFDPKTRVSTKRWALIICCAASRAVHLEILYDYSANAVPHAFERFWARRGLTEGTIFLDQATAFQASAKLIANLLAPTFQHKVYNDLQPFAAMNKLKFRFAPVRAPWHQGAVERLVAITKASIRPALWRRRVSDEELQTLLCKVEAVLNTRPLTAHSNDPGDHRPLTPAGLIAPNFRLELPAVSEHLLPPAGTSSADALRALHRRREQILDAFWNRWRRDYLQYLHSRHLQDRRHSRGTHQKPCVGQLYLLTDSTPRSSWKTCRVLAVHPDSQNITRYVTVRTSAGHESLRPVEHLIPLEADIGEPVTLEVYEAKDESKEKLSQPPLQTAATTSAEPISARSLRAKKRQKFRDSGI